MGTEKVLVAMSGGVDSSVAAKLLTDAGYDCVGCMMKLYDNEDAGIPKGHTCCSLDDVEDARSVVERVLAVYPDNAEALQILDALEASESTTPGQ